MTGKKKAFASTKASENCSDQATAYFNGTENISKNQGSPVPGTALCAFLKRYRNDLLKLPCTRQISGLVDSCDNILKEAEASRGC